MAEKIKAELLSFLKGSELPLSILVVESVGYLPALRRLFPRAALYAVPAGGQPEESAYAGLSVHGTGGGGHELSQHPPLVGARGAPGRPLLPRLRAALREAGV